MSDVTGYPVESETSRDVPCRPAGVAASIVSKKAAEGLAALVLDVKVGRGGFLKTEEEARRLAEALVRRRRLSHGVTAPGTASRQLSHGDTVS